MKLVWLKVVLLVVAVISITTTAWLASEHKKKFDFMAQFIESASEQVVVYRYIGAQSPDDRGMRNIVLVGRTPFTVLVGFELEYPLLGGSGFDYYGFVQSYEMHGDHVAVIRTFLGTGLTTFQFLVNRPCGDVVVKTGGDSERLTPGGTYPPHWYQKYLGFYG